MQLTKNDLSVYLKTVNQVRVNAIFDFIEHFNPIQTVFISIVAFCSKIARGTATKIADNNVFIAWTIDIMT